MSNIEEFNNVVYTHEERKPPDKLSTVDQVLIFSGKEPDVLLKLDIKYENPITYICKFKEPTYKDKELQVVTNSKSEAEEENVPATFAPSLQTRREIASFVKSLRTKDLALSKLWKKICLMWRRKYHPATLAKSL